MTSAIQGAGASDGVVAHVVLDPAGWCWLQLDTTRSSWCFRYTARIRSVRDRLRGEDVGQHVDAQVVRQPETARQDGVVLAKRRVWGLKTEAEGLKFVRLMVRGRA